MATYTTGRGFSPSSASKSNFYVDQSGNIQRGNVHGEYGFSRFWRGRDEFSAGGPSGDWRVINRPSVQEGRGPMGMPKPGNLPSPARLQQRVNAAIPGAGTRPDFPEGAQPSEKIALAAGHLGKRMLQGITGTAPPEEQLTQPQYRRWNKRVGSQMGWGGSVEQRGEQVPGSSLAPSFTSDPRPTSTTRVTKSQPVATPTTDISQPQGAVPKGTQFTQIGDVPGMSYGSATATRRTSDPGALIG